MRIAYFRIATIALACFVATSVHAQVYERTEAEQHLKKDISGIENLDLTTLDGAAERAHRCLSRIWDHAR